METQLATLLNQKLRSDAPAVITLKNQIKSTQDQLRTVEAGVAAGKTGDALSAVVAEYEQLDLERQFAQTMVTSAMQALDQARANAAAQTLYITPYVRPSLPQSATYPRTYFYTAMIGGLCFALWVIGVLAKSSIRERYS
jgi:capsular polysaccharide transport system permease protein